MSDCDSDSKADLITLGGEGISLSFSKDDYLNSTVVDTTTKHPVYAVSTPSWRQSHTTISRLGADGHATGAVSEIEWRALHSAKLRIAGHEHVVSEFLPREGNWKIERVATMPDGRRCRWKNRAIDRWNLEEIDTGAVLAESHRAKHSLFKSGKRREMTVVVSEPMLPFLDLVLVTLIYVGHEERNRLIAITA